MLEKEEIKQRNSPKNMELDGPDPNLPASVNEKMEVIRSNSEARDKQEADDYLDELEADLHL